jgi:hypothetical protein
VAFNHRYIFLADKVEIQDITKQTCLFVLVGPKSNQVSNLIKFSCIVNIRENTPLLPGVLPV